MIYYFAYGSNMDELQMKKRCPSGRLIGKTELRGYALKFTIYSPQRKCGCADIVSDASKSVWGLLYVITAKDLRSLDAHEGTPIYYRRISVAVTDESGIEKQAETYEVVSKERLFQKPSRDYQRKLVAAAEKFSFPTGYKTFLKEIPIKRR
jgi:gamma-glutamylcyclotransferase (GGCT)/AIG2-like uncharacterized protein YtfP